MNALRVIEKELRSLGYKAQAIIRDYKFADVLSVSGEVRSVDVAAFTQTPESFRSAAFGVIAGEHDETAITSRRALGAPILFSIGRRDIGVWRVNAEEPPLLIERVGLHAVSELFSRHAEHWKPQAVHRAKSLGQTKVAYQLDFVDLGLLPAIEREVEAKLDRLLHRVIEHLMTRLGEKQEEAAFRITFRLLAAKILLDREHPIAAGWKDAQVSKILFGIKAYYNLGDIGPRRTFIPTAAVSAAWDLLKDSISFRNISSDSLAFVYENTLVTADTRKRFGTHSTPRQLAEYVVGRLNLEQFHLDTLTIYEPFTGAGSFLVAAVRYLRDLLPQDLSDKQRHDFLVKRIRGAEIDSFACEVAVLSLILADYPNANGWKITQADLFRPAALARELSSATIILCNPPWEDFTADERTTYADTAANDFSKPMAVLQAVLRARPEAVGFVLPQGLLRQTQYSELRQQLAAAYGRIELTQLPDRIFQQGGFEGAVLVASDRRKGETVYRTRLTSTVIEDRDRNAFLATGRVTAERSAQKTVTAGDLWLTELDALWEHLRRAPKLGKLADVYRGLKWWHQADGVSRTPKRGFVPGVFKPGDSLRQFELANIVFLNMDAQKAMFPGPLSRPWSAPKVLTNVARLSRGPWRMAAAYDASGLVCSQAFFGVWPTSEALLPQALEAILNGPLTNAFLTEHASNQHFTNELLKELPMPKLDRLASIVSAVERYREARRTVSEGILRDASAEARLADLLVGVDAEVLKAYDLPPRLERQLLEFFRGYEDQRRVGHAFHGWLPQDFTACVPLHEYLGPLISQNRGPWVLEVFKPAPDAESEVLERFVP